MPDQGQILLQTKLHRPRLPHDLVLRTRLEDWLNHGIDHPLTLVCAPAGFGKTTLVCTWLEGMAASQDMELRKLPSAWLSLDENDSDLNLFLIYFSLMQYGQFSKKPVREPWLYSGQGSNYPVKSSLLHLVMISKSYPENSYSFWMITIPSAIWRCTIC